MGFEEVLIHFFDRISRAKKVKSRVRLQDNFSESTRMRSELSSVKRHFRFPIMLPRRRRANAGNGF